MAWFKIQSQFSCLKVILLLLLMCQLFFSFYLIYYVSERYDEEEERKMIKAEDVDSRKDLEAQYVRSRLLFIAITVASTVSVITGLVGVTFESYKMILGYIIFTVSILGYRILFPFPGGWHEVQIFWVVSTVFRIILGLFFLKRMKDIRYKQLQESSTTV